MTVRQVLKLAAEKIKQVSDSPWLDSEVLLSYTLKVDRAWLGTYPEKRLTKKQYSKYKSLINRRLKHEPVAYITGHKEFYGLDFFVNKKVMIPRPETEMLVEEVLKVFSIQNSKFKTMADIGTGSGCIACALAKNLKGIKIYATDISYEILKIARKNAQKNKVLNKITFLKGDLLEPLKNLKINLVVANLPYLTTKQWLSTIPEIRLYEPRQALDGGKDGLDYIKKLLDQVSQKKASTKLKTGIQTIVLEMGGKRQANKIKKLAKKYWPKCKIKIKRDLRELDRVVIIFI